MTDDWFDPFKARKCPKCGKSEFIRTVTWVKKTRVFDGRYEVEWIKTDAAHYECSMCGFEQGT